MLPCKSLHAHIADSTAQRTDCHLLLVTFHSTRFKLHVTMWHGNSNERMLLPMVWQYASRLVKSRSTTLKLGVHLLFYAYSHSRTTKQLPTALGSPVHSAPNNLQDKKESSAVHICRPAPSAPTPGCKTPLVYRTACISWLRLFCCRHRCVTSVHSPAPHSEQFFLPSLFIS